MSAETLTWLNRNVLVGMTKMRGDAWHYQASEQGEEPNHYTGAIPIGDVNRRLFNFEATERPVYIGGGLDGTVMVQDDDVKAIVHSRTGKVFRYAGLGYQPHQFSEWLLGGIADILDTNSGDLVIGSAGLLREGAVAWVQVEMPETIQTPEGVAFRPHLMACTAHNGTLKTTFKVGSRVIVCDNTMSYALDETTPQVKIGHTRNSLIRMGDTRDALDLVVTAGETFAAEVAKLTAWEITDTDLTRFLNEWAPIPGDEDDKSVKRTKALNRRDKLMTMWGEDPRVAPWKNTAWGALSLTSTYRLHEKPVRNVSRVERNGLDALTGQIEKDDQDDLRLLRAVLA